MSGSNYNQLPSVCTNRNRMMCGAVAVVAAVIIIVGAAYAFNNSVGSDTSGDDTRPVVSNVLPGADLNVLATTAPAVRSRRHLHLPPLPQL